MFDIVSLKYDKGSTFEREMCVLHTCVKYALHEEIISVIRRERMDGSPTSYCGSEPNRKPVQSGYLGDA